MSAPASTLTPDSTDVLLHAAKGGDPLAWEELIRQYGGFVRATVTSFRLRPVDVEDAVQNTWLRVMERASTIRDPQCLWGWLKTTASRECLALIRRRSREMLDEAAEQLVAVEAGPEQAVIDGERRRVVNEVVAELSGGRRLMIELLFYHPACSYAEVARATGMPLGSIGPTRGRALRELRDALERDGFDHYADP